MRAPYALAVFGVLTGCLGADPSPPGDRVAIGLLLSFSGNLAANSINSERALLMAVETVNRAGGIGGRQLVVEARDTRSDPRRVTPPARALIEGGAVLFIGPDTNELAVELKPLLADRTVMMPGFATADWLSYKPPSWFVMGAPVARMACELHAQLRVDGRKNPLVIADASGYSSVLGWELTRAFGLPLVALPGGSSSGQTSIAPITSAASDAYLLVVPVPVASSLFFSLAAVGALADPSRWYLSPTLHTPALLETVPRGMLDGARGVASGTAAGGHDFGTEFVARWQDAPLDDAFAYYDAGAVAALALQRALARDGVIPANLAPHIVAVTRASGTQVGWNQLEQALALLRAGQEVEYVGLTGVLQFDVTGQTAAASAKWWSIGPTGFADIASQSNCK